MRITAMILVLLTLVACGARTGPAGQPSSSDVNPITGSRGGSGAGNGK